MSVAVFDMTHRVDIGKDSYKDKKLDTVTTCFVILLKFSSICGIGNIEIQVIRCGIMYSEP